MIADAAIPPRIPGVRRPSAPLAGTLFRSGDFEVRLATREEEVREAQRLRFRVFFEEGVAVADRAAAPVRRDICPFDEACDHLLVIDHAARGRCGRRDPVVVGTYRLLRQDVAARTRGFYSAGEFAVAPLLARHPDKRFLELGRSCVAPAYRARHALDLLWRGVAIYIAHHGIDVLMGCASFPGTDAAEHGGALRFLATNHRAPAEWRAARLHPVPREPARVSEEGVLPGAGSGRALPPLIKGYLRCGAMVSDGFAVDHWFGTTDVFCVMPVARIAPRYLQRFARDDADAARSRLRALTPSAAAAP